MVKLASNKRLTGCFVLSVLQMMNDTENYTYTYNDSDYNYTYNDSDYNFQGFGPCPQQDVLKVLSLYINSIICVLGFVGNCLVIVTYAFYKRTKSMTDVFLFNMALADLLFAISLPLIAYNEMSSWPSGTAACKLLRGSYSVNLYSGMLLLACISVDRYVAIVKARRSFKLRSLSHSRLTCAIVWAAALLLSVPTAYFYTRYEPSHEGDAVMLESLGDDDLTPRSPEYVCEFKFSDSHTAERTKVAIPSTQLAMGFFLPLVIMIFCYTSIVVTLLRAKNYQRHKAVRVVLAVVVVFIGCHLPYNVTLLYDTTSKFHQKTCEEFHALQVTIMATQTVAYLHCCLNPVLYVFVGAKFRNHFRRILHDLWCLGKRYMAPRRFSGVTSNTNLSTRRSVDGSSDNGSSFTM